MGSIMKRLDRRTWALITLVLMFATVGAGFALGYLSSGGNVTAEGLSASADDKKQRLLDGLKNGQILYWKTDEFQKGRPGPGPSELPERLITETWLTQGEDGRLGSVVGISRDTKGNAVIHGDYKDGQSTTRYLDSGEEIIHPTAHDATVEDWLDGVWDRVQSGFGKEDESKRRGTVNGMESVIFEWQYARNEEQPESGHVRKRVEMVIDDPLLAREATFDADESGVETLVLDFAVTEYRLLPAGSEMPDGP